MERIIEDTPASIVEGGEVHYGVFRRPFRNMNIDEAAPPDGIAARAMQAARLKEWIGYGIIHPEFYVTIFLLDAKYVSTALFCVADRAKKKTAATGEHFKFGGGGWLSRDLWGGRSTYRAAGFRVDCRIDLATGKHVIKASIKGGAYRPGIEAEITLHEDLDRLQPLVLSMPLVGDGCSMYTHKAPMPAEGWVRIGAREFSLDPARDIAILDEHRSFLPFRTKWRWATFAGRDARGRLVSLNIGDHDTVADQEQWNENCVWVDGRLSFIGAAAFIHSEIYHRKPWKITDKSGRADVIFYPDSENVQKYALGPAGMNYFQMSGRFRGFVVDAAGEKHIVKDYCGVAEAMDARF